MDLYPIHLKFDGRAALVVGGGDAAALKIRALVQSGARVRVVARHLADCVRDLIGEFGLTSAERDFEASDLDGIWVVVGAADDASVNHTVFDCARRRNILVNVVDDPDRSDFVFPAVLRRGGLIVTVSTSGCAPAFASRLRDFLGEIVGEQFGAVLPELAELRRKLRESQPDPVARRDTWYAILDQHVLPALKRGECPVLAQQIGRGEQ